MEVSDITDTVVREFAQKKPDINKLRKEYPEISHLLVGEFADAPTPYDCGVVSWPLIQKPTEKKTEAAKGPTYGIIPPGHYEFKTETVEIMHFLGGTGQVTAGRWGHDDNEVRGRGKKLDIADGGTLVMDVKDGYVYYLCEYLKYFK